MGENPRNTFNIAYMENDIVNLDTPNETVEETVETPTAETTEETIETPEVDVEQLQATNKKLFERAKKAEADLKIFRSGGGSGQTTAKVSPQPNIEEAATIAALQVNGMPDEMVDQLRKVAKLQGVSLLKAQNDPIFVAVKEKFEKEQKQKDASLPASRGSGGIKAKKTFSTPGLTRDEHRKMVMESR